MSRAQFVRAVDGNAHAVAPLGAPLATLAPTGREFLRVPGRWLASCGHGDSDRVFPVIQVDARSDWWTFAVVDASSAGGSARWVVHVPCRGASFQSSPDLLPVPPVRVFSEVPQPTASPWGAVQTATAVAPGIWFVSTESHGGYLLSTERRLAMPEHLKTVHTFAGSNWFEEDCDWCVVALAYPDTFPAHAMEHARATLLTFDHEPRDAFERGSVYHKTMRRAAQAVRALEVAGS